MNTAMNENSSQNNREDRNGGRRGGNRGPRRNNNGPRRDGRPERSNYGNRETRAAKPLTLWQKIVALFTGKKPAAPASAPRSVHPTEQAYERRERSESGRPSDSYRRRETRPDRESSDENSSTESQSNPPERAPREERAPRSIEIVEVTSSKLYVGNLSFDAGESDLFDLFNGVGKVRNAEVVSNNYTQKSKGFAFVTMETIDEAKRAVVELHDKEFMGRKLTVSGAKTAERSES